MVEIFCKRSEIMPCDESIDQHDKKRSEEMADVDRDKTSPEGLFKGTFNMGPLAELLYDEADGVLRCPHCQHEHEGGPLCAMCGTRFEHPDGLDDDGYDFPSDLDDADLDLDDLEVDVDQEYQEYRGGHFHHFLGQVPHIHHLSFGSGQHAHFHSFSAPQYPESLGENSSNDSSGGSEEEEDEDEGSLQDFVVRDDEPDDDQRPTSERNNRQPINDSDDDSDEGGPVAPRRRHQNRRQIVPSSSPIASSIHTATDSENGDVDADAAMLRHAGWSPLGTGNETDSEEPGPYTYTHETTEDELNSDDESDTNTMRNEASDGEDDEPRDDLSETPTYQYNGASYMREIDTPDSYEDGYSEADFPHSMDRDGDTEMSPSPAPSRSSREVSISTNGYGYDVDEEREIYGYDDEETPRADVRTSTDGYDNTGVDLGVANVIHDLEEGSSDTSIQPTPRRRPRQHRSAQVQQTDPRISMMFAEHQMSLRGAQNQLGALDEVEANERRAEPASRNRRMTFYRYQPPRLDGFRSSLSPSVTRIISSSNRVARPPRQYQRRYH
jgi:hypothetical protein